MTVTRKFFPVPDLSNVPVPLRDDLLGALYAGLVWVRLSERHWVWVERATNEAILEMRYERYRDGLAIVEYETSDVYDGWSVPVCADHDVEDAMIEACEYARQEVARTAERWE